MTAVAEPTVSIDLSEDTWQHGIPHDQIDWLREHAPVFWHPYRDGDGYWAVTRYDDIKTVSHDPALFSSAVGATFIDNWDPGMLEQMQLIMVNMDPPRHTRFRKIVSRGFTVRAIQQLQERTVERTNLIIDRLAEHRDADFVVDAAMELPLQVICEMIGVPLEDRRMIFDWSNAMVGREDPEYNPTGDDSTAGAASINIFAYCHQIAQERRVKPRDDIMSLLVHAEVDGDRLTDDELASFFMMLAVAGNETTRNALAHSVLALSEHPDELAKLTTNPDLWNTGIEELLRWATPIIEFRRTATADTSLSGQPIAAGQRVVMYYHGGNFDPSVFRDPHTLDVTRTPNEHVTFGAGGIHFCLGAQLARMELRTMLPELYRRLPDLTVSGPPDRLRSGFVNGIKHLPVTFTPA